MHSARPERKSRASLMLFDQQPANQALKNLKIASENLSLCFENDKSKISYKYLLCYHFYIFCKSLQAIVIPQNSDVANLLKSNLHTVINSLRYLASDFDAQSLQAQAESMAAAFMLSNILIPQTGYTPNVQEFILPLNLIEDLNEKFIGIITTLEDPIIDEPIKHVFNHFRQLRQFKSEDTVANNYLQWVAANHISGVEGKIKDELQKLYIDHLHFSVYQNFVEYSTLKVEELAKEQAPLSLSESNFNRFDNFEKHTLNLTSSTDLTILAEGLYQKTPTEQPREASENTPKKGCCNLI